MLPCWRPRSCRERVDAQRLLHRSHDAGFGWICIGGECLGETISTDPEKAMVVRGAHGRSARRRWPLLAQSFNALAFIQRKGCDVHERLNVWSVVRRAGNHNSGVRMTNQNGGAFLRRHEISCDGRSEERRVGEGGGGLVGVRRGEWR